MQKSRRQDRHIWDAETLFKAIDLCEDDILKLALNLSFAGSLRMGELLALTWDCVEISPESISAGKAYVYVDKELQRVSREAMSQIEEQGIKFKFPAVFPCCATVLVLKVPKTKTSVRKVFLPSAVAEMLVERRKAVDEIKELLGDEYKEPNILLSANQISRSGGFFGLKRGLQLI